jgi:hypothetical protein
MWRGMSGMNIFGPREDRADPFRWLSSDPLPTSDLPQRPSK